MPLAANSAADLREYSDEGVRGRVKSRSRVSVRVRLRDLREYGDEGVRVRVRV